MAAPRAAPVAASAPECLAGVNPEARAIRQDLS
eukprot:COSAG02_NODE_56799_length_283_cov_1.402174_1_plen_32_part_01